MLPVTRHALGYFVEVEKGPWERGWFWPSRHLKHV